MSSAPAPQGTSYSNRRTVYPGYSGPPDPTPRDLMIDLLQSYQSTESFNGLVMGEWAEVTPNAEVRGGLLTVRARESGHTAAIRSRLKEYGVSEFRSVPQDRRDRDVPFFASTTRTDLEKFTVLVGVLDDFDGFFKPITDLIAQTEDRCIAEMLHTILEDEKATTDWFIRMQARLSAGSTTPSPH